MIHKEDIDKIFEAARVEEVVADYVTLKKRGVNLIGLCPFHDEKTPSFYVSPAKGIYKCFGCGKGGGAVNFVMEKEQMSYPEALRHLAKKYNIEIVEEEQTPEQLQTNNDRESLFVVSSYAQKHFSENLYNSDEGKSIGLGYFKERGFREDIVQKFQLGYSINKRTEFTDTALANGHKFEYLVKSGLTIDFNKDEDKTSAESEHINNPSDKKYVDRFAGRVMFPVHNIGGRVIAFGGRTLRTDKKVAKYINSPEMEIYHKSDVLYGIYFAKAEIIKQDNCFLVEGYTDVISMHQAGIENVVASSGTSLTVGQIKLIRRFSNNITILYDGDSAGIKASFRGIDLILEEGMNVKVLLFPDGEDPDSYAKRVSSEELKAFIKENSKDFISFKTSLLMGEVQNDPIKKAQLIKEIVESIAIIPEAIYRSVYIKECSRIMDMQEEVLLTELNKIRRKKFNEKSTQPLPTNQNAEGNNETEVLEGEDKREKEVSEAEHQERKVIEVLLKYGNEKVTLDQKDENGDPVIVTVAELLIHELTNPEVTMLENKLYNSIYNEFVQHLEKDTHPDNNYFINHPDTSFGALAIDLLYTREVLSNWEAKGIYIMREEDDLKKLVLKTVYTLKCRKLEMMIDENQKLLKAQPPEEEMMALMQTQHGLILSKKTFNALLDRIIIK